MTESQDTVYMQMAFELAEKARGWASPNPYVGAVIVKNNRVIGKGYHEMPGKPHAEVIALKAAGNQAKKATIYVTLEPCVHWGRTPPCADHLIQAGLKRAVISSYDPNPVVFQKGVKLLRKAGLKVEVGLLKEKNQQLNESYFKFVTQNIPFVTAKAAISLDGKIATRTGSSKWISTKKTREHMHKLRGEHDAILVGIQTILNDDPLLTVRHPLWKGKKICRILIDTHLRIPRDARILKTLKAGEIIILTGLNVSKKNEKVLTDMGVEIKRIPGQRGRLDLKKGLKVLGSEGISSVFVEGGGQILTSMIENNLVDKLILSISPKIIGGREAPSFFLGKGVESVGKAARLKRIRHLIIDEDVIMEGYL